MFVMILLVAFESLAVTTAMPTVATVLDGAHLYQLAFAGAIAAGIVGMVVGGAWCDRSGPRTPLTLACAAFAAGLAVAALAPSMEVLVAGRLLQGLGGARDRGAARRGDRRRARLVALGVRWCGTARGARVVRPPARAARGARDRWRRGPPGAAQARARGDGLARDAGPGPLGTAVR